MRLSRLKGQTALEYLMTYGWAILIVIIVVGALFALGLTKPCRWVGTQVREFADFRVENPKGTAGATGSLAFDLSSLKPQTVNLTSIAVSGDLTGTLSSPSPTSLGTAAVRYTVTTNSGTFVANDCYNADVTITYNLPTAAGLVSYTSTGKISGILS